MTARWKRLSQAVSLLILLALHITPSFAAEEIVFGPRDFTISWLHLHLSLHTFPVDEPGEGTLIVSKKTPEKRITDGYVLLNNQLVGLHEFFQGEDVSTQREVSLRSTNYIVVFLAGAPDATLSIMVKKPALIPSPQVTFQAQPQTITLGETSTLEWTTAHADTVAIEPGIGEVSLSGSHAVSPERTITYTLTATGPGGIATGCVEVQVLQPFQYESLGLEWDEQEGGEGLLAGSVRILNGNAMQIRPDLDFPSPNRLGFSLLSVYNSRHEALGSLGYGWTHTYEAFLAPAFSIEGAPSIRITDGTGKMFYFREEGPGVYSGLYGEHSRVRGEAGGYAWHRLDGSLYRFSSSGLLLHMEDGAGNRLTLTYDTGNRLQKVTDEASGRVLSFHYTNDLLDHISGPVTDAVPDGVWVAYGYDGNRNLTTVTYADGSGYRYSYEDPYDIHNLTRKTNLLGHILREWTYNAGDQVTACLSPDGKGASSISYGDNRVEVRDVYDVERTYTLATVEGRKKVALMSGIPNAPYAEHNALRWEYDERARLIEVEYGGGRIDLYQDYDERGNPGTIIPASGSPEQRVIRYTYHPEMNAPLTRTETSALKEDGNKVTIWDYDDDYDPVPNQSPTLLLSRIVEQGYTKDVYGSIHSYEYVTVFTYNSKGLVLSIDGPRPGTGDATSFAYHADTGDLQSITRPHIGSTYFSEHDAAGRPGRITDVNNRAKGFTYDGRGRITGLINYADNPPSLIEFGYVGGLLDSMTDPDGVVRFFDYDEQYGRLAAIMDGEGNYIYYTYEAYPGGNLVEESTFTSDDRRSAGKGWSYEHPDYPGKLYREIQADGTYRENGYDEAGNLAWVIDPKGNLTSYFYDFMDRIVSVAQSVNDPAPRDVITDYAYDLHGNLAEVIDGEGHRTVYVYDDMGRVVSTASPDTGTTAYAYDEAGNLRFKRDAKNVTVEYTYDYLNRATAVLHPDPEEDISYAYDQGADGKGRLSALTDPSGTMSFGYDPRGRLVQKTSIIESISYPVTYAFTPGGRVGSVSYPNGRMLSYARNQAGKISEVTGSGMAAPLAAGLTYRPFGGPLGMATGSGGVVNNVAGECDCITVSNPGSPREQVYGYDANRNLISITGTNTPWHSRAFEYDELNRLVEASGRYGVISYAYDDAGNRLSRNRNGVNETYTYYPGTNSLESITGGPNPRTFTYDGNGNIIGDGVLTFLYDQSNRLVEVWRGTEVIAEYGYNALGQRVKKTAHGVTTVFHYDLEGKLIAEGLPDGAITREYLYMGKVRIAMVEIGTEGEAIYHYLNDRLGTPEILTDAAGTVVWEAWYEPFGQAQIHPSSTVVNNHRFPGQYYDTETGLHYNYHRYYDPKTGRYITPDPIGQAGGITLYTYANNNPINAIDLLGLIWVTINVDYHGVSNWSRGILKYLGELIGKGQFVFPSDESFVGATRTVTQRWDPDPDNPCEDDQYAYGTLRVFDQIYMKHLRQRNDLTRHFPEPFYYQWQPYAQARSYIEIPEAKIIDRTPYIQNPR